MNSIPWLKRICSVVLAACLFLPMSQCSSSKTEVIDDTGAVVKTIVKWTDLTPLSMHDGSVVIISLITLLFVWPLLFQLASYKWHKLDQSYIFLICELLLLCGTSYYAIQVILLGQRIAYGAYVFTVSASIYAIITMIYLKRRIALTTQ